MSNHLVNLDSQHREVFACRRLLGLNFYVLPLMKALGLDLFSWYIIEIKHERLVTCFKGDVDILAGRLSWRDIEQAHSWLYKIRSKNPTWPPVQWEQVATTSLVAGGSLKWPPPTDRLVAIEAKCSYNPNPDARSVAPDDIKSAKTSRQQQDKIRTKIDILLRMGFDRAGLLEFIANPPLSGLNGWAFIDAGELAQASLNAFLRKSVHSNTDNVDERTERFVQKRLLERSPAGHFVLPLGAVVGADESFTGGGRTDWPINLRSASENNLLRDSSTQEHRKEMERNLSLMLGRSPVPLTLPVIMVSCGVCGELHRYDSNQESYACGAP